MKSKIPQFILGSLIAVTSSAHAATETKAATGTDLAAGASWADASAPTTADPAIINWTGTSLGTGLTLGSAATWYGMSVQGSADASIGITGANTLTLGSGGIMIESTGVNTSIGKNIALGNVQTWSAASGKTLTVSGVVSGSAPLVIGAASQTTQTFLTGTAQTLFTGVSLNNLIAAGGMVGGAWVASGNNLLGTPRGLTNDGTTASYWLDVADGGTKSVQVQLSQSGGDITGRVLAAQFNGGAGTLATSDAGNGYGAHTTTLITQSSAYSGTVSLSGNNTFSGGLTVAGGTLTGSTGVAFNGTQGGAFGTGAITVNTGATVTTGAVFMIGGNASTRVVNLNGGTLNLQGAGAGGEYIRTLNMTGGTLNNTSGSVYFRTVSAGLALNSLAAATSSTITTGIDMTFGNIAVNTANGAAANDLVISGVISQNTGAGSGNKTVTKDGAGTLLLSGANTYAGGTIVNGGTLTGSAGVLFDSTQGGSFGTGAITVNSGATLTSSGNFVIGGGQSTTRVLNLNGGTLDLKGTSTGGEYIRTLNLTGGTVLTSDGGSSGATSDWFRAPNGGLSLNSLASSATSTISTRFDLTLGSLAVNVADGTAADDLLISGNITQNTDAGSGARTLTKTGTGTLHLSGANAFTGVASVNAGMVKIGNKNALGAFDTAVTKVVVADGGTVDFNGVVDATYGYTISGTGADGNGALVNNGSSIGNGSAQTTNIKLAADASIGGTGNWALLAAGYAATSLDLNGKTLTKSGSNTFTLVNATLTSGNLTVSGGTLATAQTASNGSAAALTLNDTAGVGLNLGADLSVGSLSGGGTSGGNIALGGSSLTVGALNASTTYAGIINGTGSLIKTGTGTMELTGANTYTGATTASAGTLLISGALGNTAVSVANDAVFGGTGTVGGNVSFDGNSFLQVVNIADALVVGGTVTFGSGFGIDNILGLDWDALALNQSYTLLSTTTVFNDTMIENFGIDNKFAVGAGRYAYFENGSLAVVVVPEPKAALLGGLGLLALLRRRRA